MFRYGQYCPVSRALEVLGDRWTLLIVRDMLHGVRHFNELARGLPSLSRGLLSKRLHQLQRAGVVEKRSGEDRTRTEYVLTDAGAALLPVVESLMVWGADWALEAPMPPELDPVLLMWWMRRRVRTECLPSERVVVQFDFREVPERSAWLVLDRQDVSVCLSPPPFDVSVWVDAELDTLYQVWLGRQAFMEAVEEGAIELRSLPTLERAFPDWFAWSPAAEAVRAARMARAAP